jgi:drug/metabolite transporter (DMT)-like permease
MLAIGATGFAGSLCWFWAYSLTLVAYVKAVGQIEAVLAVGLALFVWREPDVRQQLPGVLLIMLGIGAVLIG